MFQFHSRLVVVVTAAAKNKNNANVQTNASNRVPMKCITKCVRSRVNQNQ